MHFCKQLLFHFSLPAFFNSLWPHSDFTGFLVVDQSLQDWTLLSHLKPPSFPPGPSLAPWYLLITFLQMAQCISTWYSSSVLEIKCRVLRSEQKGSTSLLQSHIHGWQKVAGETHKTAFIGSTTKFTLSSPSWAPAAVQNLLVVLSTPPDYPTVAVPTLFYSC